MRDLLDLIGGDAACEDNYCGRCYWKWEQNTATPRLIKLGYRVLFFKTGDGDSFGPLTRVVYTEKSGKTESFIYG